jgi:cytochrome c oxidase subunit 1
MGIFAGLYHWYPKMFGRFLNATWGQVHFWGTFLCMNGVFFPMHIIGMGGYPRRYANYTKFEFLDKFKEPFLFGLDINQFMTWSALLLGLFQVPFFINFFGSMFAGKKVVEENPWKAGSLEWSTVSPPPHLNWPGELPRVYHGPYEYSHPNTTEDFAPQWEPIPAPAGTAPAPAGTSSGGNGHSQ